MHRTITTNFNELPEQLNEHPVPTSEPLKEVTNSINTKIFVYTYQTIESK